MSDCEDYYFSDSDEDHQFQDDHVDGDNYDEEQDEEEQHEEMGITTTNKPNASSSAKSLDEQDVIHSMNEIIQSVSSLLSLPLDSSSILLRNFNWDILKLQDVWFSDQSQACQSAGLQFLPPLPTTATTKCAASSKSTETNCPICFTTFRGAKRSSAACGHLFCNVCWKKYINIAIDDGFGCLTLRCPAPDCSVSLDEELIDTIATDHSRTRYKMLLMKNFVECSKTIRWCPAPGCEYAIEFTSFTGQEDVSCKCGYRFCWDCGVEPHRPVDCETAKKWEEKNNADSLNTDWILVNSKPCPKCRRSIEKNQGCNHMTCTSPCRYQFCWICLDDWGKHNDNFYLCNKLIQEDINSYDEEVKRVMAKIALEKYTHYYERWMNNYISGNKALESLNGFKDQTLFILNKLYCETDAVLERCFVGAWRQIIECRRVLRWTYAYGYYLPEDQDHVKKTKLFEDLQGQAEAALERLHYCVEKELEKYLMIKDTTECSSIEEEEERVEKAVSKEFSKYLVKVTELTNTTRRFFDNLVHGLETGLI